MKTQSFLFALTFLGVALAGCADTGTDTDDDMQATPTPAATATPAAMTPTPTPATPTDEGEGGMPPTDPRCLAPPENPMMPTSGTRLGMPELSFTTSDPTDEDPCYRFHGPQNATSGWNVFTLTYPAGGRTFHIMPMYNIGDKTMADVQAAMASGAEELPEWAVPSGAVGGVTSGQTGSVAVDLDAGNYLYFCPIEGHMFQGMMGMLSVTEADNESAEPTADATITLQDYTFDLPENMTANTSVIKVVNNGTEPHEAPLALLDEGTNMSQFLAALESETPTGPPPGALVGGSNAIAPGQTVYLLVDLQPGRTYGMVCFVSSASHGGAPHVALGMVNEFTVAA